jgi:hypothetical protein
MTSRSGSKNSARSGRRDERRPHLQSDTPLAAHPGTSQERGAAASPLSDRMTAGTNFEALASSAGTGRRPGQFLFAGRRGPGSGLTTRQYSRLVGELVASIGLDPLTFGMHSLRRTRANDLTSDRQSTCRSAASRPHQDREYHSLPRRRD